MEGEWDLGAVVKSCATSTTAAAENPPAALDLNKDGLISDPDFGKTLSKTSDGLEEVHKEGFTGIATGMRGVVSISFKHRGSADEEPPKLFTMEPVDSHHGRKRKTKSTKRVVEMREEELTNDGWAWRKYGQKPIKGSPYSRNYYRCSTSKDCVARKQVDRNPADASTFIVSYSGDHLHPPPTHLSSLAGTTRSTKFSTITATDLPKQLPCSSSSPVSTSSFSPTTSLKADETEMINEDIDELIFYCSS